jgi:hypothetical protein
MGTKDSALVNRSCRLAGACSGAPPLPPPEAAAGPAAAARTAQSTRSRPYRMTPKVAPLR